MTSIKHNFSTLNESIDPFMGLWMETHQATQGFTTYVILFVIYIVLMYVYIRKTQDQARSFVSATHIIFLLSILLYYAGKKIDMIIIPDILMLGIVVLEAVSIALIYYMRMSKNEG
jgi:uncharacterized membrane-anchored protein